MLTGLPVEPRAWTPHFIEQNVDACMELQKAVNFVDGVLSGGAFAEHGSLRTTFRDDQRALSETKVLS
jgi:hypothetical protein